MFQWDGWVQHLIEWMMETNSRDVGLADLANAIDACNTKWV